MFAARVSQQRWVQHFHCEIFWEVKISFKSNIIIIAGLRSDKHRNEGSSFISKLIKEDASFSYNMAVQGNMKQHQMTHKFREGGSEEGNSSSAAVATSPTMVMASPSLVPMTMASPGDSKTGEASSSSPLTSPPSSETLSPPYRGEKRPGEETGVLQPEKRAILCG